MVFTREKMIRPIRIANDVFSRVRKMIRPIRSQVCEFRAKIPAFFCSLAPLATDAASHTYNEKSFSRGVFLVKKSEKHLGNWSGIISFLSLSIKLKTAGKTTAEGEKQNEM